MIFSADAIPSSQLCIIRNYLDQEYNRIKEIQSSAKNSTTLPQWYLKFEYMKTFFESRINNNDKMKKFIECSTKWTLENEKWVIENRLY